MAKQKFCSISKWLEEKQKSFYNLLDEHCLLGLLNPRAGELTLLCPSDKLVKELSKLFDGNDANYLSAVKHVKACLLRGIYEHNEKEINGAPNLLGESFVMNSNMKLSASNFAPTPDRTNMAVIMLDGKLPTVGTPRAEARAVGKTRSKVSGGGYRKMTKESFVAMINQKVYRMIKDGANFMEHNPYVNVLVSLFCDPSMEKYKHLIDVYPDQAFYAIFMTNVIPDLEKWIENHSVVLCDSWAKYREWLGNLKLNIEEPETGIVGRPAGEKAESLLTASYNSDNNGGAEKLKSDNIRWIMALRRAEENVYNDNTGIAFLDLVNGLKLYSKVNIAQVESKSDPAYFYGTIAGFAHSRYYLYRYENYHQGVPVAEFIKTSGINDTTYIADDEQGIIKSYESASDSRFVDKLVESIKNCSGHIDAETKSKLIAALSGSDAKSE